MDQTSTISDAFSQTSSLLSGLLSQIGTNGSQNNLFSSLLSQSGGAAPAAQVPPVQPTTSVPPSALLTTTPSASASDLLQNLEAMAVTMKRVLNALHQNNANNQTAQSSGTNQNSQTPLQTTAQPTGQTPASSGAPSNSSTPSVNTQTNGQNNNQPGAAASSPTSSSATATSTDTAAGGATAASSTTPSTDAQTLAGIIAQLLALTELMIKNLQQTQTAGGANASGTVTVASAAASLGVAQGANALLPTPTDPTTSSPADILAGITPAADAPPADALSQLLADLQKITQQFLFPQTGSTNAASSLAQAASTTATAASSLATQIALLDAKLKDFLLAVKQIDKIANAANTSSASTQTDASTAGLAENKLTTDQIPSSPAGKQDLSGTSWQSQMFAVPSPSSNPQSAPPTSAQVFANSAAMVATADNNSGNTSSNAGSDMLSGDRTPSSSPSLGIDTTATAEGVQAAGTYNFASTLSAIRATNGGSIGLPNVVDQVILQMNRSVKSGNDQMSLQLNPADLGKITVKLDFGSDGKVQGTVTADNPQTLGMLQKDSRSLERALQDAGLRADPGSLQFNLSGQENGGNAGQTANNNNDNTGAVAGDGTISAGDIAGLADNASSTEIYYLTPNGVNIQV